MSSLLALLIVVAASLRAGLALQFAIRPTGDARVSYPQGAPFLGGGQTETDAWQRFHVRYYSMLLLFIAFEMEMMFMYPWATLMERGMFLAILSVAIVYAWREGAFRWQ